MSAESISAMRADLAGVGDPAAFLEAVLAATGVTLSAGQKAVVIATHTREQIMTRFATEADNQP